MKRTLFFFIFLLNFALISWAQNIRIVYHNVNNGVPSSGVNTPGTILYPTGYQAYDYKTPVIFVHGFTGKLTGAYEAHINEIIANGLHAAFVQLKPMGTTEENGMLLKRMIDEIAAHFGSATVSIVAHSKGGMDTERALYGHNPYNYSIPSFGYEKVDAVYTFGSPLKGARLADIGSSLSWTGIAWIAMWITNGFSMTSSNVQAFHNWAQSWQIQSNGTFRNYYNPNGASYVRINMVEDNTTRWWAHQSDDPCYGDRWYFCYAGDLFHHTAGAYYDAYWEWDWFNSGWRNWHTDNDGFIAVYRARREVIRNASPALTPGAGDSNYITMNDADHISLWDPNQRHFQDEVAPYLHRGLYGNIQYRQAKDIEKPGPQKDKSDITSNPVYVSNGNIYIAQNGGTEIIIENDQAEYEWIVMAEQPVKEIVLNDGKNLQILNTDLYHYDSFTQTYQSYFQAGDLKKGKYMLSTGDVNEFIAFSLNLNPVSAFAVKWNYDEHKGYEGKPIEIKISGLADQDYNRVNVRAELTQLTQNGQQLDLNKIHKKDITVKADRNQKGYYRLQLPSLTPGEQYAIRIIATLEQGETLLARNAATTFYVYEPIPVKDIEVSKETTPDNPKTYGLDIYPNPAFDIVNIQLPFEGEKSIQIMDLTGKILFDETTKGRELTIPVHKLNKGTYLIKILYQNKTFVEKLIVK